MAKYEVAKISVNGYTPEGKTCYEHSESFDTWAELTKDMHQRDRYANEMFCGKGSAIFCGGIYIGNIKDFYTHEKAINRVTLAEFKYVNSSWPL